MNRTQVGSTAISVIAFVAMCCGPSLAPAQRPSNKLKLPKPEQVTLRTKDGMQIRCAYYPGGVKQTAKKGVFQKKLGKTVVPVILLHGWEGERNQYASLANSLQSRGHAVVVPDLRGHGDSATIRLPNGAERRIDRDRMRPAEIQGMVFDVQAVKKFMLTKNNEGELNIELLCVVGAKLGAIVGLIWAQRDWSRQQLPSFKQGQDVKALVLLTPQQKFKGMTASHALKHPVVAGGLSMMIVVGNSDRKNFSDAKAIHKRLERFHRSDGGSEEDLFFFDLDTSQSGTELVDPKARLKVDQLIGGFIRKRLEANSARFPWTERRNPLSIN
jgi:pimeloyl-ACP methyl ester carboxylesterase